MKNTLLFLLTGFLFAAPALADEVVAPPVTEATGLMAASVTDSTPQAEVEPAAEVSAEAATPTDDDGFASPRPAPKGSSKLASAISETRRVDDLTEGEAFLKTLSPELRKTLAEKGQALMEEDQSKEGAYAGYIKAVAVFEGSKERVFELITEPNKQVLYLPRLETAETITAFPNGELTQFSLGVLWSSYHFRVQHWYYPEASRVEWHLSKTDPEWENDIEDQEGYWQLYAAGPNLTIGEYGTYVNTGLAVPKSIQDFFAKKDIPGALTAFRKYISSDGAFRR